MTNTYNNLSDNFIEQFQNWKIDQDDYIASELAAGLLNACDNVLENTRVDSDLLAIELFDNSNHNLIDMLKSYITDTIEMSPSFVLTDYELDQEKKQLVGTMYFLNDSNDISTAVYGSIDDFLKPYSKIIQNYIFEYDKPYDFNIENLLEDYNSLEFYLDDLVEFSKTSQFGKLNLKDNQIVELRDIYDELECDNPLVRVFRHMSENNYFPDEQSMNSFTNNIVAYELSKLTPETMKNVFGLDIDDLNELKLLNQTSVSNHAEMLSENGLDTIIEDLECTYESKLSKSHDNKVYGLKDKLNEAKKLLEQQSVSKNPKIRFKEEMN